ncbi:MAG: hypothetical protein U9O95_06980 [Candidatus Marinimicrobia bacterium]|nr:hypothetical protein [Candidatus Neomarinimicrobiota bacterium]
MKYIIRILFLILTVGTIAFAGDQSKKEVAANPPDALGIAHELEKEVFNGWSYGSYSTEKKHLDCTTFVSAVVNTILSRHGAAYTKEIRNDVLINHPNLGRNVVQDGPDTEDPRYGGVAYAIVKHNFGIQIKDMSQVKPGDFIQYWKQRKNGTWFGHASLIESVRYDKKIKVYKAKIFGSHKSTDGIAVSKFELYLSGDDRVVYIGRIR